MAGNHRSKGVVANASAVAALCSGFILFGIYTVNSALDDPLLKIIPRDLDVVELWSGVGTVVAAANARGYKAMPFDKDRIPGETEHSEDITSLRGFQLALRYVMRLKIGALLHMAPVCSSFVFANSSNCRRTGPDFEGNLLYDAVIAGNLMATISAFFMLLAHRRQLHASAENPSGSMYFSYKPLSEVFDALGVHYQTTDGCCFSTKRKGQRFLKRFKFAATGKWIAKVYRRCRCPDGQHVELMTTDANGGCSGTPQLKQSQAYPKALGAAIVTAWKMHQDSVANADSVADSWTTPFAASQQKTPPAQHEASWARPFAASSSKPASPKKQKQGRLQTATSKSWTTPFAVQAEVKPAKRTLCKAWCKVRMCH